MPEETPLNIPICFRNYKDSETQERVSHSYQKAHQNMTYDFVCQQEQKWLGLTHGQYTIWEIIDLLNNFVDKSDPDLDIPNIIHCFQTAESIRREYPSEEYDWFHLVGLLHDLGKIMAVWGEPEWLVVGDTHPVGCGFSKENIFAYHFIDNPDFYHNVYSTKYGIYDPKCGLEKIKMSWGHDEYMYQILKKNKCTIPKHGLDMIRYHSFYAWHKNRAYIHLESPQDRKTLIWVKRFNKHDLYSKSDDIPNISELKTYYLELLKKYNIDGKLNW